MPAIRYLLSILDAWMDEMAGLREVEYMRHWLSRHDEHAVQAESIQW